MTKISKDFIVSIRCNTESQLKFLTDIIASTVKAGNDFGKTTTGRSYKNCSVIMVETELVEVSIKK